MKKIYREIVSSNLIAMMDNLGEIVIFMVAIFFFLLSSMSNIGAPFNIYNEDIKFCSFSILRERYERMESKFVFI